MAIRKVIDEIERRGADISKLDVLEVFAREGKWQIKYYADRVNSLTAWEYSEGFETGLRATLPKADIKICDSFKEIRTTKKKFDLIVSEGPIVCHGGYIEHFDLFPYAFRILKDHAFLAVEVYTSVNAYRKRHNREPVPDEVLFARKEFYRPQCETDGDFIPLQEMEAQYRSIANMEGFDCLGESFWEPRSHHGDMWYILLEVKRPDDQD